MATTTTQPVSAHSVLLLLPKLQEDDPDLRYMGLNDLCSLLTSASPTLFQSEYGGAARTVDALIRALQDANGEVQNMAVKCVSPFVNKVPENIICAFIEKVSQLPSENVVDTAVPALALRSIVTSLPHPSQGAPRSKTVITSYNAISRALIPRLTGSVVVHRANSNSLPKPPVGMLHTDMEKGTDSNAIDVLTDVARCFGPMLHELEVSTLIKVSLEVVRHRRTSVVLKKKAVAAIAQLFQYLTTKTLQSFMGDLATEVKQPSLSHASKKLYLSLLGLISRSSPQKFGQYLKSFTPFVLTVLSQEEIERDEERLEETEERDLEADEVRESALLALESWLSVCPSPMKPFTQNVLEVITRFLEYDPNLATVADFSDMEEEEDDLDDADFEEDVGGGDDEDDTSWKVRRCAAKVAHALIATRSDGDLLEDGTLYTYVAPILLARFKEREETVRLEVLAALATLIRITGGDKINSGGLIDSHSQNGAMEPPSRKRRRAGSDASMVDLYTKPLTLSRSDSTVLASSAFSSLESISPELVKGLSELMQSPLLATKQASIGVLRDLVLALHGQLRDYLASTVSTILEAVSNSKSTAATVGSSLAAANTYRVEALQCLGAIAEVQSTKDLQPFIVQIIPVVKASMNDNHNKVAVAALSTSEHIIDALTPPRSSNRDYRPQLDGLTAALIELTASNDVDLEVRRLAIHSLGLVLGRSSLGQDLLDPAIRTKGMELLLQRLRNETTRLTTARAVDAVVLYARNASDFPKDWISSVSTELVQQFRKASRSLRGACLTAMKTLASNPVSKAQFSRSTIDSILPDLVPLIKTADFHTLTPTLLILAAFIDKDSTNPNLEQFIDPLCSLLTSALPSTTTKAYLAVIRAYGSHFIGKPLMAVLLQQVSLTAPPELVGKVIGNLLVAGLGSVGVELADFTKELNNPDEKRKCLAIGVLGETACLMGTDSPLTPRFFMDRFFEGNDKTSHAAALALGRAGAGNISVYVPMILTTIGKNTTSPNHKQLLLHAIREIVNSEDHSELAPYIQELWNQVNAASQSASSRSVGAECLGRLAIVDPSSFYPQLKEFLSPVTTSVALRSLGLSALRVTVTSDSSIAHTSQVSKALRPLIKSVLELVPKEDDLENRRVGLTIINAAMHTRFEDVIEPLMSEVLPAILNETKIRTELIKEVTMGPFKHKVDDGLECRKVCLYLYSCYKFELTTMSAGRI